MAERSPTVCAAVFTFNRKDLVADCVEALLAQTHALERVFVIDNRSTDGTPEMLRDRGFLEHGDVEHVLLSHNTGGSGGFAAAVEAGRGAGTDWIWVMDDDAEAPPDALERLLASDAARDPSTAALCPAVTLPDGTVDLKHRGLFRGKPRPLPLESYAEGTTPRLEFFTAVGPLLRTRVVHAAGLPRADFFIWSDDFEYSFRLREHGEIRLVPESVVVHKDVGQAYENRRGRFWNRLLGWDYDPTPLESFWRNLCGVRNYIWVKKRYEGQTAISALGTTAQFMLKSLLYDEQPLRRLKWIARFARDGRHGVFNTIRPEEWAEMVRRGEV